MIDFFKRSGFLDYMVLKQLSHICPNWELTWDYENNKYKSEEDSFAEKLNELIEELGKTTPPAKYHNNEDSLAEYVIENLNWKIKKINNKWEGEDYAVILEQGGFGDVEERKLVKAAAGRIQTAIKYGQKHFDDMEEGHQKILGDVLAIILYHRANN